MRDYFNEVRRGFEGISQKQLFLDSIEFLKDRALFDDRSQVTQLPYEPGEDQRLVELVLAFISLLLRY